MHSMVYIIFFLALFLGKGGTTYDLDWDRKFTDTEMEQLALSAFFESYRESHTFDHLSDFQLRREIVRFWKNKKDHHIAHHVIAARHNGKLSGLAVFEKRDPETVYLAELMTAPDCWGQGLGTKLIYSILEKEPEIHKILLVCEKANTKTVEYYRSQGFLAVNEDPSYITFEKKLYTQMDSRIGF